MPRRKRNRARESEHDAASVPHKRRHTENTRETLFVSDSDNEEEENRPTSREVRLREREHKTLTEDLTEEEMVSLAMKLSAEEATNAALRQKEEDEAVDRAIAESLHVNDTQTELVSLEMSQDTPSSLGDIPPSAPESPVFPSRQQRSRLDSSETGLDVITRNDILHSVDTKGNLGSSQPLMSEECDSKLPTSPVQSSASEKPDALLKRQRHDAGSTSQITQGPSTFSSALGEDSVNYKRGSPFPSPVLCIQRLSQELLDDCQASGFVQCSQELPVCLTPLGGSKVFRQRSLVSSEMNWGSVKRAGPSSAVASSVKETAARCAGTQDADDSPCSQVLHAENCGDALSLLPGRKMLPAGPKHAPAEHTAGVRGACIKSGASLVLGEEEPCKRKSLPERNAKQSFFQVTNENELRTQINLQWPEGAEEDDDEDPGSKRHGLAPDVTSPLGPQSVESDSGDDGDLVPSPVFPGLRPHGPGDVSPRHTHRHLRVQRKLPFEHMSPPNIGVVPSQEEIAASGTSLETVDSQQQGMECGSVRYYWGVPFCPRGQDPDTYTRAIVTQLEVYEKSLKEARRGLLRKAEWGGPVLPTPPGRHKRSRTPRLPDDEEEEDEREEEEATAEEETVERNECADSPRSVEEDEGKGEEEEDGDTEEASSQQGKSTEQSVPEEIPGKHKSLRKRRLRKASLAEVETCPAAELDPQGAASCPDRQLDGQHSADLQRGSPDHTQVHSVDSDCEVMVLDQESSGPAGGAAEVQEEAVGQMETESCSKWVQCPICMRRFPQERIEMHAAYCNAIAEDQVLQEPFSQVTGRKQSNRRSRAIDETQPSPLSISRMQRMEKCYLCKRMLSVKDYNGHVDECIRTTSARNQEGKNLLLTLDQLEQNQEPEASEPEPALDSTRMKGHSSATMWDKNESDDQGAPGAKPGLSSSPIRSFTSISEATDCLVDFKRYSAKPGQRGRRRRFK